MKPIKRFETAIKWLDKGLELSFPGRTIIGYSVKQKKYYRWIGYDKVYYNKRPDELIKKLLNKHGEVHLK